jgi:hypothetical protein
MTKPGSRFTPLVENDLSVFAHKTDTDLQSGAHAGLSVVPVGTSPSFTIHKTELLPDVGNFTRIDLDIHDDAPAGIQVAMCTDGSENALIGSFIEVQDFGGALNNKLMMPDLSDELGAVKGPRNFGTYLRAADQNPGSGPRPSNDSSAWNSANKDGYGGVGNVPASVVVDEKNEKESKKWYQSCGTIDRHRVAATPVLAIIMLLIPAVLFSMRER